MTTVGSAGSLSASFYGTYDQGGNVWEWNEAIIDTTNRGARGNSWLNNENALRSSNRNDLAPTIETDGYGFRLASSVPEPSRVMLLLAGGCGLLMRRRRP